MGPPRKGLLWAYIVASPGDFPALRFEAMACADCDLSPCCRCERLRMEKRGLGMAQCAGWLMRPPIEKFRPLCVPNVALSLLACDASDAIVKR